MSKRDHVVIVTNAELRFGFNVIRELSTHGITCIAMGRIKTTMAHGMKNVTLESSYPNPFLDPEGYVLAINNVACAYEKVYFIPTHEDIFVAAKYRDSFEENITLIADTYESLMSFHDKWSLYEKCIAYNVPTPKTYKSPGRVTESSSGLILKPRYGEGGHGIKHITKYNNAKLSDEVSSSQDELLIQEKVAGVGVGIAVLAKNGHILAISGHKRIREIPRAGGTSCARQTFNNDTMFSLVSHMISESKFSGLIMLEFKYDMDTGNFWLIDANPRYFGGVSTHILSGVNFPVIHYQAFSDVGYESNSIVRSSSRVESRWLLGEIGYFFGALFKGYFRDCCEILSKRTNVDRTVIEDFSTSNMSLFFRQVQSYWTRVKDKKYGSKGDNARSRFFSNG